MADVPRQAEMVAAGRKEIRRSFTRELTDDGQEYFVPEAGGEAVWELPDGAEIVNDEKGVPVAQAEAVPTDTVQVHKDSKSGRRYSFNNKTKATKWLSHAEDAAHEAKEMIGKHMTTVNPSFRQPRSKLGSSTAATEIPMYATPFSHKGIDMEGYGNTQLESHQLATQHQRNARMDPRELAKSMLLPGERPVGKNWCMVCRSIELEKTRLLPSDSQTQLDTPLEELPGRVILFTNQRVIIADSSYLDLSFSKVELDLTDPKTGKKKTKKQLKKAPAALKGTLQIESGNLHPDVVIDPSKIKHARYARTHLEGTHTSNTQEGWDVGTRAFNEAGTGGPSSDLGLPLKMRAPEIKLESDVSTVDFTYFRAFPRSEVTDVRLDFISATRTSGHLLSALDDRDFKTKFWDCCCKQGYSRTNGCAMPLLSMLAWCCTAIVILSQMGGDEDTKANGYNGKWDKSDEDAFNAAMVLTGIGILVNAILLYFWCVVVKKVEDISDAQDSERHVRIKLKDQGNLILNVSWAHPAHEIARCVALILPAQNEMQRAKQRSAAVVAAADQAVAKAQTDGVSKNAADDLRALEQMLQEVRAMVHESRDKNYQVAAGTASRTRFTSSELRKK